MKATEEELKMISEFDASEGVDEGTSIYMSDDEIIDFAKQYHTKQLILHGVSKSFTAEQIVNELKEYETLDDAISFFTNIK